MNLEAILEIAEKEVKATISKPLSHEEFKKKVDEAYNRLYYYQKDAYDIVAKPENRMGRIVSPTASGKDTIMNSIYLNAIHLNEKGKTYVKASHRLSLNVQLTVSVIKYIHKEVNVAFIGTGDVSVNKINKKLKLSGSNKKISANNFIKTTNPEQLKKFIEKDDNTTFVVATYHSLNVLEGIDVEIACFDEAHIIPSRNPEEGKFINNLKNVLSTINRAYYFTATQKVYGVDGGMNDGEVFGPVIYSIAAKELIDGGYIATPKVHFVKPINAEHGAMDSIAMEEKTIVESFMEHDKIIVSDSSCHPKGSARAKMLVNSSGSESMNQMLSSLTLRDFSKDNEVKIFFIASHDDIQSKAIIDGEVVSYEREEWMDEVASLDRKDAAIIFHIRILTEGIDLPNITGVLFTRPKDIIDFLQSIGRALRRTSYDRDNILHNKVVSQLEVDKQEKPYGYVILPHDFLINEDDMSDMITILLNLVTTYRMPLSEMVLKTGDYEGITADVMPKGTGITKKMVKKLKGTVEELEHIFVDIYGSEWNFDNSTKIGDGEFVEFNDGVTAFENIMASTLISLAEKRKIDEMCKANTDDEFAINVKGLFT